MSNAKVKITTKEGEIPPVEILADEITKISEVGKKLQNSRLAPRTIRLILADATGLNMTTVGKVLDALPELEKQYLKSKK